MQKKKLFFVVLLLGTILYSLQTYPRKRWQKSSGTCAHHTVNVLSHNFDFAPNFSQVISFITGNKLSAFKTQEHHFNLIKEGYVGTLSSVDNPTFDQFKKHLLTQHKIEGIQLPNVISDVQTEEKSKTKKKKKYRKRKNKNKKDTSAYVQPMQPSATRDMGS
jgi:hypothetical protein